MSIRTALRAARPALIAASALALPSLIFSTISLAGPEILTDTPPPPLKVEHAPPARDGYVWSAGHWEWTGHSYTWSSGTWIIARRSGHWVADQWDQVGSQWHYIAGHWEH